ncbi:MAG: polysaccharide deacetylase family protein [Bacteroides sp.]|nr:polysaccharide deacetylase family protein [Bacteroides sp.]
MKTGHFLISLDFELLWGLAGWDKSKISNYLPCIQNAVSALSGILLIFEKYEMKCNIASVGGMDFRSLGEFLASAPSVRPSYKYRLVSSYDSFLKEVGRNYRGDLLFCPDTIHRLSQMENVQLATHTFSHYYCMEKGQTSEQFREDLKVALAVFYKRGIKIETIVFPGNQISDPYLKVCAEEGLTHFRGNLQNVLCKPDKMGKRFTIKAALRLVDTYLNITGTNCYSLSSVQGKYLKNVPGSRFFTPIFGYILFS